MPPRVQNVPVSVGLPTYNRADHLRNAITQVFSQTFSNFELIVADDGSTDHTEDVVRSFSDSRLTYARAEVNEGIPKVLNRILSMARGRYIVMLHDHDEFAPLLLESMVDVIEKHPSVGFVNPGVALIDDDGSNWERMAPLPGPVMKGEDLLRAMLLSDTFACPVTACALVRREAFESVGFRYGEKYGFLSDIDLWMRLARRWDVGQVGELLLFCRRRDTNHLLSTANWQVVRWSEAIHFDNANRFATELGVDNAEVRNLIRKKIKKLAFRNLGQAAAHDSFSAWCEGIRFLAAKEDWRLRIYGRVLHLSPPTTFRIARLGTRAFLRMRRNRTRMTAMSEG